MTIHAAATVLIAALRVERATDDGSRTHDLARLRTDQAAEQLAAELREINLLVALIHAKHPHPAPQSDQS